VYTTIQSSNSTSPNRNGLTAEIYEALKAEITARALTSRERLYETVLAKRFKSSRKPVREALQRLVSEGLAEVRPDGVCVAALSVQDVRSLEQANRALQSLAAELAVGEGSEAGTAHWKRSWRVWRTAPLRTTWKAGWLPIRKSIATSSSYQETGGSWGCSCKWNPSSAGCDTSHSAVPGDSKNPPASTVPLSMRSSRMKARRRTRP